MHTTLAQHTDTRDSESAADHRAINAIKRAAKRGSVRWLRDARALELHGICVDRLDRLQREHDDVCDRVSRRFDAIEHALSVDLDDQADRDLVERAVKSARRMLAADMDRARVLAAEIRDTFAALDRIRALARQGARGAAVVSAKRKAASLAAAQQSRRSQRLACLRAPGARARQRRARRATIARATADPDGDGEPPSEPAHLAAAGGAS